MTNNFKIYKYLLFAFSFLLMTNHTIGQCGQLVWSDEFDDETLDLTKWGYDLGYGCPSNCGWGNSELQEYTSDQDNIRINNGKLEIEAVEDDGEYSSAKITTEGLHTWKYGRFEMRAKLPSGTGVWPAFWMLPVNGNWPTTGEIDIMELRGDQPEEIGGTLHYGSSYPLNQYDGDSYVLDDSEGTFSDDYHVFAVEWEEGEIRWYVDDELFKTETESPSTLNPGSSSTAWPWDDQEFYVIINLAIGGENTSYTGNQDPSFGTSALMEIDYVRIYDSALPTSLIEGENKVFENQVETYSVEASSDQTYTWSVPGGASILSGQNTNSIVVDWAESQGGNVSLEIIHESGDCMGNTFAYTLVVDVFENSCEFNFESFDDEASMTAGYRNGELTEVSNPKVNSVNSSSLVGEYVRNSSEQYDVLIYENGLFDPATDYVNGQNTFKMDVMTDAAVGTTIEIQVGNEEYSGTYPSGVHSTYTAVTTTQDEWETLNFQYSQSPDPSGASYENDLDRMLILFGVNSFTSSTFYFDNIRRSTASTGVLTIEGVLDIEEDESGVEYTVSGGLIDSDYQWSVPSGAVISSGNGTSSILVDFGASSGEVSVIENLASGCSGDVSAVSVLVGGDSCLTFVDEYDDNVVSWVSVNGDADFSNSESEGEWVVTSNGYDEWATIDYILNDGLNEQLIDFSNDQSGSVLSIRAKASGSVLLSVTFVDENGVAAGNQYLTPINRLGLTTDYQDFEIDFSGQFWDEYSGGGELDTSAIEKIRFSLNPGYATFPDDGYGSSFVGTVDIEKISLAGTCEVTGVFDNSSENKVNIYPNPFASEFNVGIEGVQRVEVLSTNGVLVITTVVQDGKVLVDDSLSSGLYIIRLITESDSYISTVIKQ